MIKVTFRNSNTPSELLDGDNWEITDQRVLNIYNGLSSIASYHSDEWLGVKKDEEEKVAKAETPEVSEWTKAYQLALNEKEAAVLFSILRHIGGSHTYSPRGFMSNLTQSLESQGMTREHEKVQEVDRLYSRHDSQIYFIDGII